MQTRRFAVDDLINIPAQQIAVNEILKGTFDTEIKQITALRDDLAKQNSIAQTVEKAQALLDEATQKNVAATQTVTSATTQAEKIVASATAKMEGAVKAEQA